MNLRLALHKVKSISALSAHSAVKGLKTNNKILKTIPCYTGNQWNPKSSGEI